MKSIDRREFLVRVGRTLVAVGGISLVRCTPTPELRREPVSDADPETVARLFPQGIGSGDPRPDGVLLRTRAPGDGVVPVDFRVARDVELTDVVADGLLGAEPDDDWTVRLRLSNLEPNTTYYYRFFVNGVPSALGRTRTAPDPESDVEPRFAVASCQDYLGRYYHAWRALAEADDVDFVLFLGDYVYEYVRYPGLQEPTEDRKMVLGDGLVIDAEEGIVAAETLDDYRTLYRTVRSDPDLQLAHRMFPFVIAWDDHEFANDSWADHSVDFDEARGDELSTDRRLAATRAWYEHLPVDVPYDLTADFPNDVQTYRSFRWGRQLEIFLTDERYYRDDHVIPEGPVDAAVGKVIANSPLGARIFARKSAFDIREAEVAPTMLGDAQREWLVDQIRDSDATWKVFASALMVAQMALDFTDDANVPPVFQDVFYFKLDHWDGYRSERRDILQRLDDVANLVVLSGDLHGFWAAELRPDFDTPGSATALELTVGSISSISLGEQIKEIVESQPLLASTNLGEIVADIDDYFMAANPHFGFSSSFAYGLGVVSLNSETFGMQFRFVGDPRNPDFEGVLGTHDVLIRAGQSRFES